MKRSSAWLIMYSEVYVSIVLCDLLIHSDK